MDPEEYVEQVLTLVEAIPPGRVMSYGDVASAVGRGGPRQVGRVLSSYGGGVPWWRVVRADGGLALCHQGESRLRSLEEGTPLRSETAVDMAAVRWWPDGLERGD